MPISASYLEILRANRGHVGNAENEANGIQNIGLSTAVQAGDRVETFVPANYHQRPPTVVVFALRCALFTYHPEMTVRTAYDLKPYMRVRN